MPEAEPFKALSEGNGFPFPISLVVDVSSYHNWVTLAGVSAGTATKEQINTSLLRAVCLYWNLYSVKDVSIKSNLVFKRSAGFRVSGKNININKDVELNTKNILQITPDPKNRLISHGNLRIHSKREAFSQKEINNAQGIAGSFINVQIQPIKMYNGDPSNEDNFVGYGLKDFIIIHSSSGFYGSYHDLQARILIASYDPSNLADFEGSQTEYGSGYVTNIKRKAFDVNLKVTLSKENGGETVIPFKSFTNANSYSTQFALSPTLSISSTSAKSSSTHVTTGSTTTYGGVTDVSFSPETLLELYTYPDKSDK